MLKASILVRNLESGAEVLDFGEFKISPVRFRFEEFQRVFSSQEVRGTDWILEKSYAQLPVDSPGSTAGGTPSDIEDTLLLLRLYRIGDIAFIRVVTASPSGELSGKPSYRAMNDVIGYSPWKFEVKSEECQSWKVFADSIRESQSWSSNWFAAARRFFLSGGAKRFIPFGEDVDRIVDYVTALEATLVPEKDYNTRRISRRAAALIAQDNPEEREAIVRLMKKLYDIRSRIAHGSRLEPENHKWLLENCDQIELRVRQVLATAARKLPPGEEDRRVALAGLYDPTDEDRGSSAFEKFREIKTAQVRKAIAAKISKLAGE
jgi:hypothetical protein